MTRYWVSWWSELDPENVPFSYWVSGWRCNPKATDPFADGAWNSASICALIDAPDKATLWDGVGKHFPDFEVRFCEEREPDYTPGDRFTGGGRTSLDV